MNADAVYRGGFGELRIETDMIDVTSIGPEPDPDWDYTDHHEHRHFHSDTEDPYPTLKWVIDYRYWCEDCHDEHTEGHRACKQCDERISPGTMHFPGRRYVPGLPECYLNGEPISPERARELIVSMEADRIDPQ